jgi:hypothetical protein
MIGDFGLATQNGAPLDATLLGGKQLPEKIEGTAGDYALIKGTAGNDVRSDLLALGLMILRVVRREEEYDIFEEKRLNQYKKNNESSLRDRLRLRYPKFGDDLVSGQFASLDLRPESRGFILEIVRGTLGRPENPMAAARI